MPPRRTVEVKIHGRHACQALFARRPDEVVRAYVEPSAVPALGELLRGLALRRRPYKVVPAAELEAVTESRHHEGICLVAHPRRATPLHDVLTTPGPAWLIALADVGNPHNVGAILRTAAHFGARAALCAGERGARLPPAAFRTSQGGAEWIDMVDAQDLQASLDACRAAGYVVCATTSHGGQDLYLAPLPARVVVLLGSEGEGLSPELLAAADLRLWVPGTGHVESLNVASATAALLAELWRQHGPRPSRGSGDADGPAAPVLATRGARGRKR